MNKNQKKLILSNGYLWIYHTKNVVNLFSLGDWLVSYTIPKEMSLENSIEIIDYGNSASITYPNNENRFINLERNELIEESNLKLSYHVTPKFSNSLLFRGDENLPKIEEPITQLSDYEYCRSGYPSIKYQADKQLKIKCIFNTEQTNFSKYQSYPEWCLGRPLIRTSNKEFNQIFQNSIKSLYKLRLFTNEGEIKAAGFPDFPSLFGRDFALSALGEVYLWPDKVEEEIKVHLNHLGKKIDIARNEQPGRAIHEFNYNQETMTNKYKHFPSWYANDSNALLLLTIFRLARIQQNSTIIEEQQANLNQLLEHMFTLDIDDDGFIEYCKHPEQLLIHQTWRDGGDEIRHPNDSIVKHPIAPIHDQICMYGALKEIIAFHEAHDYSPFDIGETTLKERMIKLQHLINEKYWMPKFDAYALALDGDNKQVKVVNSDVSLGYYFEVFDQDKAQKQYNVLIDKNKLLSKVGLRTVSKEHELYSPRKYQRGGVWPWQLAITIAGVRKYNFPINPFIQSLKNISQAGSIAEVYIPDCSKITSLTSCIEQRWSSAIPWLALVEGILGIRLDYHQEIDFDPLFSEKEFLPIYIEGLYFNSKRHNITVTKERTAEIREITKDGISKVLVIR